MMDEMRELYEEMILEHNRNPRNFMQEHGHANHEAHGFNPLCGDDFTVYLSVRDGLIEEVSFDGVGCALSVASASMMTEAVKGKPVEEVRALFERVRKMLTDGDEQAGLELGKVEILKGARAYPIRIKCATLPWHTLKGALDRESGTLTTE